LTKNKGKKAKAKALLEGVEECTFPDIVSQNPCNQIPD
jgi:hypothetical protein